MHLGGSAVFNRLLLFTLREADGLLRRLLGAEGKSALHGSEVTRLPRWKKAEPLVKSYLGNTLHLLGETPRSTAQHSTPHHSTPQAQHTTPHHTTPHHTTPHHTTPHHTTPHHTTPQAQRTVIPHPTTHPTWARI
jgi:hypothetical protein